MKGRSICNDSCCYSIRLRRRGQECVVAAHGFPSAAALRSHSCFHVSKSRSRKLLSPMNRL